MKINTDENSSQNTSEKLNIFTFHNTCFSMMLKARYITILIQFQNHLRVSLWYAWTAVWCD